MIKSIEIKMLNIIECIKTWIKLKKRKIDGMLKKINERLNLYFHPYIMKHRNVIILIHSL